MMKKVFYSIISLLILLSAILALRWKLSSHEECNYSGVSFCLDIPENMEVEKKDLIDFTLYNFTLDKKPIGLIYEGNHPQFDEGEYRKIVEYKGVSFSNGTTADLTILKTEHSIQYVLKRSDVRSPVYVVFLMANENQAQIYLFYEIAKSIQLCKEWEQRFTC